MANPFCYGSTILIFTVQNSSEITNTYEFEINFVYLETLFCRIDVSKNKSLQYLYLENNPNLRCIKVNPDQLTSIPVNWKKTDDSDYLIDCDKFGLTYIPDNGFETFLINLGIDDILDDFEQALNLI